MIDLKPRRAFAEFSAKTCGDTTLQAVEPRFITSIMAYDGQHKDLVQALKRAHGLDLPQPGHSAGRAAARLVWTGRGQYFLIGDTSADPAISQTAALSDQSDGWAVMALQGRCAAAVLARVCPLDTRPAVFRRGHVARTEVQHMMAIVLKTAKGFDILVMRSFAQTAWTSVSAALDSVDAQSTAADRGI